MPEKTTISIIKSDVGSLAGLHALKSLQLFVVFRW